MAKDTSSSASELVALREDLLQGRPGVLRPDQGAEALEQFKLLAARVHRAAKLDERKGESETEGWVRYLSTYFPPGHNDAEVARRLFVGWRTALLKLGAPGPGVALTHGQPILHWQWDQGQLALNLEDTWDDYEASVHAFVDALGRSHRRKIVLKRWRRRQVQVRPFSVAARAGALAGATVIDIPSASVSGSPTTIHVSAIGAAHAVSASALLPKRSG